MYLKFPFYSRTLTHFLEVVGIPGGTFTSVFLGPFAMLAWQKTFKRS